MDCTLELEYDTAAKKYKPIELPSLREIYSCIQDTVPIITESVSHLAGLFKGLDISTDQFSNIAKRCSAAFWGLEETAPCATPAPESAKLIKS